jgi:hypothetical protein
VQQPRKLRRGACTAAHYASAATRDGNARAAAPSKPRVTAVCRRCAPSCSARARPPCWRRAAG